jgi:hypothetical protein
MRWSAQWSRSCRCSEVLMPDRPVELQTLLQSFGAAHRPVPLAPRSRRVRVLVEPGGPEQLDGCSGWSSPFFLDGVQPPLMVITHVDHRPVTLGCAAAGAVRFHPDRRPELAPHVAEVQVLCAERDVQWVKERACGLDVTPLPASDPGLLAELAEEHVGCLRESVESSCYSKVRSGEILLVDGSLRRRAERSSTAGVVKTHSRQYVPDERSFLPTQAGWRSPLFAIEDPETGTCLLSTYVRLHDAPATADLHHGLVRVEAFNRRDLEEGAIAAFQGRQHPTPGDLRWHCHLRGFRAAEWVLRSLLSPPWQ